jgi:hypothetical protein
MPDLATRLEMITQGQPAVEGNKRLRTASAKLAEMDPSLLGHAATVALPAPPSPSQAAASKPVKRARKNNSGEVAAAPQLAVPSAQPGRPPKKSRANAAATAAEEEDGSVSSTGAAGPKAALASAFANAAAKVCFRLVRPDRKILEWSLASLLFSFITPCRCRAYGVPQAKRTVVKSSKAKEEDPLEQACPDGIVCVQHSAELYVLPWFLSFVLCIAVMLRFFWWRRH